MVAGLLSEPHLHQVIHTPGIASTSDMSPTKKKRKLEEHEESSSSSSDDTQSNASHSTIDDPQSDEEADSAIEDEPVLSHAQQRRQKKKEEKAKKAATKSKPTGTDKKSVKVKNTAELTPSKIPKRQNSVWVGNLSFKTTPAALRQFFDGAGEITRIHMPMKLASSGPGGKGTIKENRGSVHLPSVALCYTLVRITVVYLLHPITIRFAYVDFATPDAKTVAVTLSENPLDGRRLLIKDGQ